MIGIQHACAIAFLCLFTYDVTDARKKQPHIVLILADDLGWDDVSFHGSSQIPTPHIDSLAASGITLNNYYVQPVCSPTRSAVMTGKYPIHTGMQDGPIGPMNPYGVPLSDKFLPQHLKGLGYSTHAVGKWHIGFFAKQYTPLYRGFDTYMGYYGPAQDYFTHMNGRGNDAGYDLRRQEEVEWSLAGQYNTEIFTTEAESIISTHNTSEPLFLYLAQETPHTPLQAPQDWIDKFSSIVDEDRRTIAAMISYMDHCVGRVRTALSNAGMLDDTILIFSTDNGGEAARGSGSNFPLRGSKGSLWQGGVRGAAVISGGMFESQAGTISNALMHVSDWLPTLVDAAGGDLSNLSNLDGVSQLNALVNDQKSSRSEILLNIGDTKGSAALIVGNMKIISGERASAADPWFLPAGSSETVDRTVKCGTKPSSFDTCSTDVPCLFDLVADPCEYNNLAADFGQTSGKSTTGGNANGADCYFPFEYRGTVYNECTNVAHTQLWCATTDDYRRDAKWGNCVTEASSPYESEYALMKEKLSKYKEGMVPSAAKSPDSNASPSKHGGVWEPWVEL